MCYKKIVLCCGLVFSGALYACDRGAKNKDAQANLSLKRLRDTTNEKQSRKRHKTTSLSNNGTVLLSIKYPSVFYGTNSVGLEFSLQGRIRGAWIIAAVEKALQRKGDVNVDGGGMRLYENNAEIIRSHYYYASKLEKLEVK